MIAVETIEKVTLRAHRVVEVGNIEVVGEVCFVNPGMFLVTPR
jgi:hypothetical protein